MVMGYRLDGKKGFQAEVWQIASHVTFVNHIIHTEALATCDLELKSHSVLQEVVKSLTL
jgi:hypothetical protein